MSFNIDSFHASLSKTGGVAFAHTFEVEVPGVVGKRNQTILSEAGDMTFRIDSINIPPRSITDVPVRFSGAPYRFGVQANYVDVTLGIILSSDLREKEYFLKWQDAIGGNHRNANLNADEKAASFGTGYYDDYVSDGIKIKYYSTADENPVYTLNFIEAYPVLVSDLSLSWSTPDALKMNVTIAYRYFTDVFTQLPDQQAERRTGLFERLNQLGIGGGINSGLGAVATRLF